MEVFAYGGMDHGTIKAFLHLTDRITRGYTTADILSHLPQTSGRRPLSYLSIYSDSPLLPDTWSQVATAIAGPLKPSPTSFRDRMTPSTKGLAPSLTSSRHHSWMYASSAFSPRMGSTVLNERTAIESGDRWVSPGLVDEPQSEMDSEPEDEQGPGRSSRAQEKEGANKGKKSRRRFWLFKKKRAEPKLQVHGLIKDLLDRAVWTMQTGHRATGTACCDQCCDCQD